MWLLRDTAFDIEGRETHKFWSIETVDRSTLPPSTPPRLISNGDEESHVLRRYRFGTASAVFELRLRVFLRPIALELLEELNERGFLQKKIIEEMPTFELTSAMTVWRADEASPEVTRSGRELLCVK